jgi:hypothetical protein
MRKNRSVKEYSLGKGRRSQGKEISIELDAGYGKLKEDSHRGNKTSQSSQFTERMDRSVNPISHNILKDIINNSHISQSHLRSGKSTTLAAYDRHHDIMSQFSKISKKTSLGDVGKREHQRLVLDQHVPSNPVTMRSIEHLNDHRSI